MWVLAVATAGEICFPFAAFSNYPGSSFRLVEERRDGCCVDLGSGSFPALLRVDFPAPIPAHINMTLQGERRPGAASTS